MRRALASTAFTQIRRAQPWAGTSARMFCTSPKTVVESAAPAQEAPKAESTATPEKKPLTLSKLLMYAAGALSTAGFSYCFYKSDFNLHRTEIMIGEKLAKLPFYWPPGPSQPEKNTSMPVIDIPASLADQLSAWFIYMDAALPEGVRRNQIIELMGKLGLVDPEIEGDTSFHSVGSEEFRKSVAKAVDLFIEKGRGRLSEYKRKSGASLQESVSFLNELVQLHQTINPSVVEPLEAKLHDVLGHLVETMPIVQHRPTEDLMPEIEASEKEFLEMELSQLERSRDDLRNGHNLSQAESTRLTDIEAEIKKVKQLITEAK